MAKNRLKIGAAALVTLAAAAAVAPQMAASYAMPSPAGLTKAGSTHNSLSMTWQPVENAPRYRLQVSKSATMSNPKYYRSAGPNVTRTITPLDKGTTYYLKVRVITEDGTNLSPYSGAVRVATAKYAVATPTDLLADTITKDSAVFRWDAVEEGPRYRIAVATTADMAGATYHYSDGPATSLKVTGLKPSTNYFVKVRVAEADGSPALSYYSGAHPFTTLADDVQPPPPPPPPDPPATEGTVDKVLVFFLENKGFNQVKNSMPFTYGLGKQYGIATAHKAHTHPSLPNYIAIAFGSTQGVSSNIFPSSKNITAPTVFGQAVKNNRTAKTYADGMPSNCYPQEGGTRYAPRHNPHAYADSEAALCKQINVPYASNFSGDAASGNFPNVGMVIPNNCNNSHDCSMTTADNWFKARWNIIEKSSDWKSGKLLVIFTADEDNKAEGNRVFTGFYHPALKNKTVSTAFTHYSLSRLLSQVGHSEPLLNAKTAPDMAKAFGLKIQ